ncbi:quorum sensing histidine kinase QseC [Limnobaculum parvum]|uniref:Sensor protein QseC n=1 Tax=Limnobaculum parvum TaxID=2172103 RepID=A0A2Y9TV17_9GAMM|nr:quorum sensing histidine kinase QseC [Limnobaculum parvum]AWH87304.1 two-component system sensor histidine kinase QseC [Limnobaculum parvum]
MKTLSLRLRLILLFILLVTVTWSISSFLAWRQTSKNIDEMFDTQQMIFAKRLTVLQPAMAGNLSQQLPKTKKLLRHNRGSQDDDALAFAIFTPDGEMVLHDGDNGSNFIFNYHQDGFANSVIKNDDDLWRIVWLKTVDNRYIVAVGQELDYRADMLGDLLISQIQPWLIALPLMAALMVWLITRELQPLRHITNQLNRRQPDDESPLNATHLASEIQPIVNALNKLFTRIGTMLVRERRFTSDAAHELRTPLAALRVQTEVVQISGDDEAMRQHALANLTDGIDRSTRVVDQLLMLSRLDSFSQLDDVQQIEWQTLLQHAIADIYPKAQAENVDIRLDIRQAPMPIKGQQLLLSVMLRNLLDNAIRYGRQGNIIMVTLDKYRFSVEDEGPGVSNEYLQRIGERFFRPPGQEKTGSGLGLSIVQRIAHLHGLDAKFSNREQGGFEVVISWH